MLTIIILCTAITVCYMALILVYRKGWKAQRRFTLPDGFKPATRISIIIPARNEEQNIAHCIRSILANEYPRDLYEIIVVDDHSTDRTAAVVKSFDGVRYIDLSAHIDTATNAYKKKAIATGIQHSNGELIITTDADCVVQPQWLRHIAAIYQQEQSAMIIGPVDFSNNTSAVETFQSLDFMSMQGITAAAHQMGLGNMCNGANLAFTRAAYDAVGGYAGVDHLASGDDYLLLMKVQHAFPGRVSYLLAPQAIVKTAPQPDWNSFMQQRIRWASKSGKYDDKKITGILAFVYLFNLLFLALAITAFFYPWYWAVLLGMLVLKTEVELFYLYPVARFYKKEKQLLVFPLFQPLHILYIIAAGLLGFVGVYQWKGREVK